MVRGFSVPFEVLVLVAVTPALLFPSPLRLIALLALVPGWVRAYRRGERIVPGTPLDSPLAVISAMALVSMVISFDLAVSLPKVTGLALGLLVFWTIVRVADTDDRRWRGALGLALVGGGVAAVGLVSTNWQDKLPIVGRIALNLPRLVTDVPGAEGGANANALAGTLVLFLPLQLTLAIASARRLRIALTLACALTGVVILLTQSRGGWLGLAVGLVMVALVRMHRPGRVLVRAGVSAAVAFAALTFSGVVTMDRIVDWTADPTAVSRLEVWSRSLEALRDFWLTGLGMGTFRHAVPVLYPVFTGDQALVAHAHNQWLQAALDLGLAGGLAYAWTWLVALRLAWGTSRRGPDARAKAIGQGLLGGFVAHAVFGLGDAIPLGAKVGVFFWMALAFAVAPATVSDAKSTE